MSYLTSEQSLIIRVNNARVIQGWLEAGLSWPTETPPDLVAAVTTLLAGKDPTQIIRHHDLQASILDNTLRSSPRNGK